MIKKVETYCLNILNKSKCNKLPFHDVNHTQEVVNSAQLIASECGFSKQEIELVVIAAWFHDTGFSEVYKGHEEVSKKYASEFLLSHSYSHDKIEIVLSCIEATKVPQNPSNKYGEVLCDADIYNLSQPHFFYRKLLLKREWQLVLDMHVTDEEWHQLNLEFAQNHRYFSSYGKSKLKQGRLENVEKVKNLLTFYKSEISN